MSVYHFPLLSIQQIVNTPVPDGQQPYGGNSGGGSAVFPQDFSGIGFAIGNLTVATTKLSSMINHINETAAAVWSVVSYIVLNKIDYLVIFFFILAE